MTSEAAARPHCIAVVGGAVAGAEVAGHFSAKGATVVVFEQNPRPFGKIEDGLPRWHHKLREKEYRAICKRLSHPNVHYVPNTAIGTDIDFAQLCNDWGFSAVVLASGAWRDRPVSLRGADNYIGKGLIYQNPFVSWWNHLEEANDCGPSFEIEDNTIVLGGGLASIDVAKIVMLETTRAKLLERNIEVDVITLEVKGIPKILDAHGLGFEELGLAGCTIFYRRRIEDMPVVAIPEGATAEREEKTRRSRQTLLGKAMRKYCFKVQELSLADSLIIEDDRLAGLTFRRTRLEDGRVVPTDESFEHRCGCVISSIGSIPETIPGVAMKGELYDFSDWEMGRLPGYPSVFSVGNVVTGKGNIVASRKHAAFVSSNAIEAFLGISDDLETARDSLENPGAGGTHQTVTSVSEHLSSLPPPSADAYDATLARVSEQQRAVDCTGGFEDWLKRVAPQPR